MKHQVPMIGGAAHQEDETITSINLTSLPAIHQSALHDDHAIASCLKFHYFEINCAACRMVDDSTMQPNTPPVALGYMVMDKPHR